MSKTPSPKLCPLCGIDNHIRRAGFHQIYPQKSLPPIFLNWWECLVCHGWFVHPVASAEVIERYWETVPFLAPRLETNIARAKNAVNEQILKGLSRWTVPGPLLDFGCNFGQFLLIAQEAGWKPYGFEPSATAADRARLKGFDVRCAWSLQKAGFTEGCFRAITANDVFCYVWLPIAALEDFYRYLRPGGVLAMRITNKRFIAGLIRTLSSPGSRDERISRILQGQFHSVSLTSLSRILRGVGFDRVEIKPRAMTAPWNCAGWRTNIAYLGADLLYLLSVKTLNLSPGVLIFAQKPTYTTSDTRNAIRTPNSVFSTVTAHRIDNPVGSAFI